MATSDAASPSPERQPVRGAAVLVVSINGNERQLPAGTSIADLLARLELTSGRCAVEVNRRIVPRSDHEGHLLESGDAVEIVSFVGGG